MSLRTLLRSSTVIGLWIPLGIAGVIWLVVTIAFERPDRATSISQSELWNSLLRAAVAYVLGVAASCIWEFRRIQRKRQRVGAVLARFASDFNQEIHNIRTRFPGVDQISAAQRYDGYKVWLTQAQPLISQVQTIALTDDDVASWIATERYKDLTALLGQISTTPPDDSQMDTVAAALNSFTGAINVGK